MRNKEIDLEQARMNKVINKIKKAEKNNRHIIKNIEKDSMFIQKDFKNNIRVNNNTYSGIMDTALSIRQQQQLLQERENNWQNRTRQLLSLNKLEKRPYFARIDFNENNEKHFEKVYIGLSSFYDDEKNEFLIYDWRAPISSVYYNGKTGPVTYDTPDGTQKVNLTLKRQFMVKNGKILSIFDTNGETLGDQLLLQSLSDHSDTKMKSIVTTIQRDQNKVIRDTTSKLLFVQGPAGSGKTAAILQRVAYLLYHYRNKLNSSQILLFSPNQMFNDYINHVLPDLGEQNMVQVTFYQYVQRRLPKFHILNLEEIMENRDLDKPNIRKFKESLLFFNILTKYGNNLVNQGLYFKSIKYNGHVLFSKDQISNIYYNFNSNYNLRMRLFYTKEKLIKQLNSKINKLAHTDKIQREIQNLSNIQLSKLYEGKSSNSFRNENMELKYLSYNYVYNNYKSVINTILHNGFININFQYFDFLNSIYNLPELIKYNIHLSDWKRHLLKVKSNLIEHNLSIVDTTPYLYLYDLIIGKHSNSDIKQIFIDEIQDYSPFQLSYIKKNFPNARYTMLGDLNQCIFNYYRNISQDISIIFGEEDAKFIKLNKTYRSTRQITEFTKELLNISSCSDIEAFNRDGELPAIIINKDYSSMFNSLLNLLHKYDDSKTAIICKNIKECQYVYDTLVSMNEKAIFIKSSNQRLVNGPLIIPSYLSKGLEFDNVIIWNASKNNYYTDQDKYLLYTICSRAMHRLSLIVFNNMSPILNYVNKKRYTIVK